MLEASRVALDHRQLGVAPGEVGDRVHRNRACEQSRKPRNEQERLLAAHAAAERVDPPAVDVQPRERGLRDLRHPREIVYLAGITEREPREPPAHPVRVDDGEATDHG